METTDKQFYMVFTGILVVLVLITIFVAVVANISSSVVKNEKSDVQIAKTLARIQPVGQVNVASAPNPNINAVAVSSTAAAEDTATSNAPLSAEQAYNSICQTCHNDGLLEAPKLGDAAAWKARLSVGKEALYNSAINGKGLMAPKGGNASLSDDEVKAAVDYLIEQSK